jgi:hypothetical protein
MPEISSGMLWVTSIGAAVFALFCLVLAYRNSESRFLALATVAAGLYAVYFELKNVSETHDYFYIETPWMLGDAPGWVPLGICLSWASIFFVTTKTTDLLAIPWYQRPFLAGLLAVLLDFVGDPIVSARCVDPPGRECFGHASPTTEGGVGLWIWSVPPDSSSWMNVPLGNYVGWIVVVAVLGFAVRSVDLLIRASSRGLLMQLAILAVTVSAAGFVAVKILRAYSFLSDQGVSEWLMLGSLLAVPTALLFRERRRLNVDNPLKGWLVWGLLLLPILSYLSPWIYFFALGVHQRFSMPQILVMAGITALGLVLFVLPHVGWIATRIVGIERS